MVTSYTAEDIRCRWRGRRTCGSFGAREKILGLIAEGKTNKEIAKEVFLSDKTVKNYASSILSKLNLRRRSEAAAFIAERRAKALDES
jgi:DNA-binding NarL/FixJ family response regulator